MTATQNGGSLDGANWISKNVNKLYHDYLCWALGVMGEGAPAPRQVMCLLGARETIRRLRKAHGIMWWVLEDERPVAEGRSLMPSERRYPKIPKYSEGK